MYSVEVRLLSPDVGGRRAEIPKGAVFRCPVYFEGGPGDMHDAALLFETERAEPGGPAAAARLVFLCPELVVDRVREGTTFVLWDGRPFGLATVVATRQEAGAE